MESLRPVMSGLAWDGGTRDAERQTNDLSHSVCEKKNEKEDQAWSTWVQSRGCSKRRE